MAVKMTLEEMRAKNVRLNASILEVQETLKSKREKLAELERKIAEEERKIRTHNLCSMGGLVYKYFGDDISPDEFKEALDFLFDIGEVKKFVESEKEKRFLRDNPPMPVGSIMESSDISVKAENTEKDNTDVNISAEKTDPDINENYNNTNNIECA